MTREQLFELGLGSWSQDDIYRWARFNQGFTAPQARRIAILYTAKMHPHLVPPPKVDGVRFFPGPYVKDGGCIAFLGVLLRQDGEPSNKHGLYSGVGRKLWAGELLAPSVYRAKSEGWFHL